jgi:hypothetical protein
LVVTAPSAEAATALSTAVSTAVSTASASGDPALSATADATSLPPGATSSCTPEPDEDHNGSHRRCVNGSYLWTRGYNRCLSTQRPRDPNVYLPNECYGPRSRNDYIESIAQARLVQRLDKAWQPTLPISRGIQWEVRVGGAYLNNMSGLSNADLLTKLQQNPFFADRTVMPGMRLDVLLVGPNPETPAANPIGVLEVKGTWRAGAAAATAEAATQASGYVAALRLAGWSNTSARDTTGYLGQVPSGLPVRHSSDLRRLCGDRNAAGCRARLADGVSDPRRR